jgi:hypothetical protein
LFCKVSCVKKTFQLEPGWRRHAPACWLAEKYFEKQSKDIFLDLSSGRRIFFFTLNRKYMKSKRGSGRTKQEEDGASAGNGGDGRMANEAGADRGRQPEGTEDNNDRVIHNGSAGAFEAAEDGRYEEDSDEDNDDLAMGH